MNQCRIRDVEIARIPRRLSQLVVLAPRTRETQQLHLRVLAVASQMSRRKAALLAENIVNMSGPHLCDLILPLQPQHRHLTFNTLSVKPPPAVIRFDEQQFTNGPIKLEYKTRYVDRVNCPRTFIKLYPCQGTVNIPI